MNIEKLNELLQDETFLTALSQLDSAEAAQKLFADNGLELAVEEVKEVLKSAVALSADELDADALDNVSGGALWIRPVSPTLSPKLIKLIKKLFG